MKNPFDEYANVYDSWFVTNRVLFESELKAIQEVFPKGKIEALEIGCGTGIFAERLGVEFGIDPASFALEIAKKRGVVVTEGYAENLPYPNHSFDLALFITSICFIKDVQKAFQEANRILRDKGSIIIAFIKKDSTLGMEIEKSRNTSKFYKEAKLYTVLEVSNLLTNNGYKIDRIVQTLISLSKEESEDPKEGFEQGLFIVIKASKS